MRLLVTSDDRAGVSKIQIGIEKQFPANRSMLHAQKGFDKNKVSKYK